MSMPRRAPTRAMIAGATVSPMMDATPIPSNSRPTPEFSMPSASRMAGTREAQVEMLSPLARKIAQMAMYQRTRRERVSVESMRQQ